MLFVILSLFRSTRKHEQPQKRRSPFLHFDPPGHRCSILSVKREYVLQHFEQTRIQPTRLCFSSGLDNSLYFNGRIFLPYLRLRHSRKNECAPNLLDTAVLQFLLEYFIFPFFPVFTGFPMVACSDRPDRRYDIPVLSDRASGGLSADPLSFMVSVCRLSELPHLFAEPAILGETAKASRRQRLKQRAAALQHVFIGGVKIPGVPGIRNIPLCSCPGQQAGYLVLRIAAAYPGHVLQ